QGRLKEAVRVLEEVPEVLEATATSGPSDLLCRVVARDTEHLQDIVNRALSNPAIRRTTSYIALSEQIPYRTGPLLDSAAAQATRAHGRLSGFDAPTRTPPSRAPPPAPPKSPPRTGSTTTPATPSHATDTAHCGMP